MIAMPGWNAELFARLVNEKYGSVRKFARELDMSEQGVRLWLPTSGPGPDRREAVARALGTTSEALSSPGADAGPADPESPIQSDRIEAKLDEALEALDAVRDRVAFRDLETEVPGLYVGQVGESDAPGFILIDDEGWVVASILLADSPDENGQRAILRAADRLGGLARTAATPVEVDTAGAAAAAKRAAAAGRTPSGGARVRSLPTRRARGA